MIDPKYVWQLYQNSKIDKSLLGREGVQVHFSKCKLPDKGENQSWLRYLHSKNEYWKTVKQYVQLSERKSVPKNFTVTQDDMQA